ncbi:PAS domain-containing hybrid sensor histidine kinase/response regulator [Anaerostipes sp.]|uniref:PAS domain-containing hybrid sensor histidine kinase/response regulator n=1 Tax=Anaerostipes sp. TaxID=1872530 RepID=UPI0025C37222|nr:PAS domain-containing hybrid sensor histidine kinase/response regulator [Anaerostipes sp.]MBS7008088.1 response regulator [Anaerostipes sp.]
MEHQKTKRLEERAGTNMVYEETDCKNPKPEQQNRQLEKKASYFKWMLDEYAGNVYIADIQTYELLYLNQAACETLCQPAEKLVGRKCYEVIQGREEPCPFCTNGLLTEDEFYEWDFYNPVLKRTFIVKNRIVNWEDHRARLELSHDNMSPEYKLEKRDREREAIIRSIPGGFARVDARDFKTIIWYGGEFLPLIGYTKEQFQNEVHSQCDYVHPDDLARVEEVMRKSKATGEDKAIEARIVARDGKTKILTMTFSYVSGKDSWDGLDSFYSIGIDITKEREEQDRQRIALEDAYQAARVANAAKTNFLSSMSHDIRTPMNAIMGMAAIAQANLEYPDKIKDCMDKINTSSRHLLSLINEVLDMSKIESGKINIALEQVSLPEMVETVTSMCLPLINEKHQYFEMSIGHVSHENVVADGDRLRQVLMNILSNAIKYTPEGGTITLRINEQYSPNPKKSQYEFICIDTGIGISEDFLPHIFDPFSRAEDSRISKIQGTGLGMAITENIVRMMNGTIGVESKIGKGSKFTVSVPLEICGEEAQGSDELTGLPVLVVDDDQITCENAAALLHEIGMRGDWVLSGKEAIDRIAEAHEKQEDFFVVILDWKMPGMDGLDATKAIRRKLGDQVPIIVISAYDYSDIEEEFLEAGADAFITKPLFKSKMLQVLHLFVSADKGNDTETKEEENGTEIEGRRVLLVEDNDINREIVTELLEMNQISVDSAGNGQLGKEAFEASAPGDYSAILMDIQMPVMNGYDATAAIRSLERDDAHTIPIIALTANAFTTDAAKGYSVGMNDYLAKPIEIEHLMQVLRRWMGKRSK